MGGAGVQMGGCDLRPPHQEAALHCRGSQATWAGPGEQQVDPGFISPTYYFSAASILGRKGALCF